VKKKIAVFITVSSSILAFLYWGDPMSYGWICATVGWIDKCFGDYK